MGKQQGPPTAGRAIKVAQARSKRALDVRVLCQVAREPAPGWPCPCARRTEDRNV